MLMSGSAVLLFLPVAFSPPEVLALMPAFFLLILPLPRLEFLGRGGGGGGGRFGFVFPAFGGGGLGDFGGLFFALTGCF